MCCNLSNRPGVICKIHPYLERFSNDGLLQKFANMEPLTQQEWDVLASIRAKNYAVVVFNPEEIRNATPNRQPII
jgi:hypothetical protein